jgi:hypothetical protein
MNDFLKQGSKQSSFCLYIIQQSNDNRKFNRGKLLNIGYRIAKQDGCNVFIFHDVDLLPSNDLLTTYTKIPIDSPIHIASVWNRYNENESYVGGIVSFTSEQVLPITLVLDTQMTN